MKLIKIYTGHVQLRTDDEEFRDIRINDLLSVSDGDVELVASVDCLINTDVEDGIGGDDFIAGLPGMKTLECSIIGSVREGRFVKAIDRYPPADVVITRIDNQKFSYMLGGDFTTGFYIGDYVGHDTPAFIDGNKLYQRHSCIVGNTGSGKSETLAKILEETSRLPGANLILFDIHGEYGKLSYVDNIRLGPDFPFPLWLLGFQDVVANLLRVKEESATVVSSALRKCFKRLCPDANEGKPHYFDFNELRGEIASLNDSVVITGYTKEGAPKTAKGEYNGKLTGILNLMKNLSSDKRYSFLFAGVGQEYLPLLINRMMGGDKPVKNIDLSGVPHDVAIPIIGAITKLVFDIQRRTGPDFRPITLVCDEAHVYIPDNYQLSASERRMVEVFEGIAKEGRKFGITLFVASQRPSELNKTIMAQCAGFIVGKLNNENDKSMIKGLLPEGNESVVDSASMFSPGDVLVVGDAAPIPLKIHVELAKERPQSRTIDFWDEWGRRGRAQDYSGLVEKYLDE